LKTEKMGQKNDAHLYSPNNEMDLSATGVAWLGPYWSYRLAHPDAVESTLMQVIADYRGGKVANPPLVNRCRGALLGLAIGDALGTTLEFQERDSKLVAY
jgi:hypothetical protein